LSSRRYHKAVKQYTMAIRMDKTSCVLFSNRSGAYCGCGKYEEALADAERQGTYALSTSLLVARRQTLHICSHWG